MLPSFWAYTTCIKSNALTPAHKMAKHLFLNILQYVTVNSNPSEKPVFVLILRVMYVRN